MIIDSIQKENSKKVGKYRDNIRTYKMVNSTNDIIIFGYFMPEMN